MKKKEKKEKNKMEIGKRYYTYHGDETWRATECRVDSYSRELGKVWLFFPKLNEFDEISANIDHLDYAGIHEYTEVENENLETTVTRLFGKREIGCIDEIIGGKGYFYTHLSIRLTNGNVIKTTSSYLYWFSYEFPNISRPENKFEITSDLIGKHVAVERVDGKVKHVLLLDDRLFRMLDGRYR